LSDLAASEAAKPSGFAGWLLLPAIIVCLGPMRGGFNAITSIEGAWAVLRLLDGQFHLALEAAIDVGYFVLQILVLVAMLRRRASFPTWFTGLWLATLVLPLVDVLAVMAVTKLPVERIVDISTWRPLVAGAAMTLCVWYVHVSVRVKNTFTN